MHLDHQLFMDLANRWAQKSKCLSYKVGALIVTPDGTQVGAGYNGPPRGVPHCDSIQRWKYLVKKGIVDPEFYQTKIHKEGPNTIFPCPRKALNYQSGKGLHICQAAHAEQNALVNAAREGTKVKGLIMYATRPVCQNCAKLIVNAGIKELYIPDEKWYDEWAEWYIKHSVVDVRMV